MKPKLETANDQAGMKLSHTILKLYFTCITYKIIMSRFAEKGEIGNFVRSVKNSKKRGWNGPN